MSEYLTNRVKGRPKSPEESELAREHGSMIGHIVCQIWPDIDRRGIGDGAFSVEKFNILVDRQLPDQAIRPLIIKLLAHPISPELAFVLLTRRSAIYKNYLRASTSTDGVTSRLLGIACLAQVERDQKHFVSLLEEL